MRVFSLGKVLNKLINKIPQNKIYENEFKKEIDKSSKIFLQVFDHACKIAKKMSEPSESKRINLLDITESLWKFYIYLQQAYN
jgi:hypothetical protein